jgi:hypothetical protein
MYDDIPRFPPEYKKKKLTHLTFRNAPKAYILLQSLDSSWGLKNDTQQATTTLSVKEVIPFYPFFPTWPLT